jgi:hypothetical protein
VDVHAPGVVQQGEVGEGPAGIEGELQGTDPSSRSASTACHSSVYVV